MGSKVCHGVLVGGVWYWALGVQICAGLSQWWVSWLGSWCRRWPGHEVRWWGA